MATAATMEPNTETVNTLAMIETLSPARLFEHGVMEPILERIKREVRAVPADISTDKGRKAVASLAYKISRTKTFIEDQRLSLVATEKKRIGLIDQRGKRVRDELESLRDEVRKPLTDWENEEKARVAAHEHELNRIVEYGMGNVLRSVSQVSHAFDAVKCTYQSRDWEEFSERALAARDAVFSILSGAMKDAQRAEDEKAELDRLRVEAEERVRQEREERIAREAREKAELEAKKREQTIQREKEAAELRALHAEAARIAAAAKAASDATAAARRAEEAKQAAVQAVNDRIEREQQAEIAETAKREADREHRRQINKAAVSALVAAGLEVGQAITAVEAIVRGVIPNIKITY